MSHFDEAVAQVLLAEGGLLISDSEHGGGANFGVSLLVLQEFRKNPALTLEDLKALTVDEAKTIYRSMYWDRIGGDRIKGRLTAIAALDQAVNRGVAGLRAALIQTLSRRYFIPLEDDATFALLTEKLNQIEDRSFFRRFVCDIQHAYVDMAMRDPAKLKWLKGWLVRTHNLLKYLV